MSSLSLKDTYLLYILKTKKTFMIFPFQHWFWCSSCCGGGKYIMLKTRRFINIFLDMDPLLYFLWPICAYKEGWKRHHHHNHQKHCHHHHPGHQVTVVLLSIGNQCRYVLVVFLLDTTIDIILNSKHIQIWISVITSWQKQDIFIGI